MSKVSEPIGPHTPTPAAELLTGTSARAAKTLFSGYHPSEPVGAPGAFFGRDWLLRELLRSAQRGHSALVLGGPAVGSSSLGMALERLMFKRWVKETRDTKIVPVRFVPVQPHHVQSRNIGWLRLWERLCKVVLDPHVQGRDAAPSAPKPNFFATAQPTELFEKAAADLWQALAGRTGWCRTVLLIDGADILVEPEMARFAAMLLAWAAAEHSAGPRPHEDTPGRPLSVIFLGGRALVDWLPRCGVAGASKLRQLHLGVLSDGDAKDMLQVGFGEQDDAVVEQVLQATGKHPQLLCDLLETLLNEAHAGDGDGDGDEALDHEQQALAGGAVQKALSTHAMTQAQEALLPRWHELFERIWQELVGGTANKGGLGVHEVEIMLYLAVQGSTPTSVASLEARFRDADIHAVLDLLVYQGVLERHLLANEPHVTAPCRPWNRWFLRRV